METTSNIDTSKIRTLSWLKYIQYIILAVVGGLFAFYHLSLFNNPEEVFRGISFALGIIFVVYGFLTLLTGYIMYKSPFSQNVILGVAFIAIAFVLILKPDVVYSLFAVITVVCLFVFALLLFIHMFYLISSRKKRKRTGFLFVLSFLGSATCVGLGLAYLFINDNLPDKFEGLTGGERIIGIIIGFLLIFISFVSIIVTAKNAKNTKKIFANTRKEKTTNQGNNKDYFSSKGPSTNSYSSFHSGFSSQPNTNSPFSSFNQNKKETFNSYSNNSYSNKTYSQPNKNTQDGEPEIIDIRPKE